MSVSLGTASGPAGVRGLTFDYGSPNGGNLMTETIAGSGVSGTATQSYTYDKANRIATGGEGAAWSRGFGYDVNGYGNWWVSSASGIAASSFTPGSASAYDAANHLTANSGTYDAAGNQSAMGSYQFGYDSENRMSRSVLGGGTTAYLYDGEGRRVGKVNCAGTGTCVPSTSGAVSTWYVYDAAGQLAAEYGGAATQTCTTCWLTVDHLGSTRVVTNASGTAVECRDYLPFGEEIGSGIGSRTGCYSGAVDRGVLFTGQYRDPDTQSSAMPSGLDYFGARYFSSAQGRFTSSDTPLADQHAADPQSWNLYSYVRNNPLRFLDPTGNACTADWKDDDQGGPSCADVREQDKTLKPAITVGVGRDEANLIAAEAIGNGLSSPVAWASVARGGLEGAMAVEGLRSLPSAVKAGFNLLTFWQATKLVPASLEALAAAGGPTIEVVTSQTGGAIDASRGLYAGIGNGAEALAKASRPGGVIRRAHVPEALINAMRSQGLATVSNDVSGAKEIFFRPEAVGVVLRFFQ
jgi:RHS repeat-associated protein